MSTLEIKPPFQYYTDADGSALSNGYIYIGTPNLNPVTNQKAVFWDKGLQDAASQPIRTVNGYPSRNGTASKFFVSGDYSEEVQDKNQALVFSSTSTLKNVSNDVFNVENIATLKALDASTLTNKDVYFVSGYYTQGDEGGGHFYWDASSSDADDGGMTIILDSGATGRFKRIYQGEVMVRWFGAKGDITTDDSVAIQSAMDFCSAEYQNLYFGVGSFAFGTTLVFTANLGNPISLIGERNGTKQAGSDLPSSALVWTGGASPMVQITNALTTFVNFEGFGVENRGTATDFIEIQSGLGHSFRNMWFINGNFHTRFSRSVVRISGNNLGYARFSRVEFGGSAPKFIDIDGLGTSNGITPVWIGDRSVFESNGGNDVTIVHIKDETLDMLTIEDCTINPQSGAVTLVDTTDSPLTNTINVLVVKNNEYDVNTSAMIATDRMMKLENVNNTIFTGNQVNGGGTITSLIDLTNSHVSQCEGNYCKSINGPVFEADATSRITVGQNELDITNTMGWADATDGYQGFIAIPYAANSLIPISEGRGHIPTSYELNVTNATGYTITYSTNEGNYIFPGMMMFIRVKNTSGGAISNVTFNSAFKTAGATTKPTDTNSITYGFVYDGTNWIEISRNAVEVPN